MPNCCKNTIEQMHFSNHACCLEKPLKAADGANPDHHVFHVGLVGLYAVNYLTSPPGGSLPNLSAFFRQLFWGQRKRGKSPGERICWTVGYTVPGKASQY